MLVSVKFFVFDLPPDFRCAELSIKNGATLSDAIDACTELLRERGLTMDEKELRTATILINGKWSGLSDPVPERSEITVIRPMDGG